MMIKKLFLLSFVFLVFITPFVSSDCTLNLDKTNYTESSSATWGAECSLGNEKSQAYNVIWIFNISYIYRYMGDY